MKAKPSPAFTRSDPAMAYAPHLEEALRKYRPRHIKLLFIAEAPPALDSSRFFYFPDLRRQDTLFLEMMKVMYPADIGYSEQADREKSVFDAKRVRRHKAELLRKFQCDGFYLIDASEQSMPEGAGTAAKRRLIREALPGLRKKVKKLCANDVPVILISHLVYEVCAEALRQDGVRILNTEMIDHPARGGQKRFRRKFGEAMRVMDWLQP